MEFAGRDRFPTTQTNAITVATTATASFDLMIFIQPHELDRTAHKSSRDGEHVGLLKCEGDEFSSTPIVTVDAANDLKQVLGVAELQKRQTGIESDSYLLLFLPRVLDRHDLVLLAVGIEDIHGERLMVVVRLVRHHLVLGKLAIRAGASPVIVSVFFSLSYVPSKSVGRVLMESTHTDTYFFFS